LLVASSSRESPFKKVPGKQLPPRLNILDSNTPLIRTAAEYLYRNFGGCDKIEKLQQLLFSKEGQRYFVEVVPFSDSYGLKRSIAIAVPESDFMGQINSNTRTAILLCLAALLVSTAAGAIAARWVTQPLLRLNEAAKDIAKGEFDRTVAVAHAGEVGELAQSFNEMAVQLKKSFQDLAASEEKFAKLLESLPVGVSALTPTGSVIFMNSAAGEIIGKADYHRKLEIEVADRTIELAEINARLELEIEERKQAEKIIRKERDFTLNIIQNSPTFFVALDSSGQIRLANRSMLQATGYTAAEVTGKDYLAAFVPEGDRAALMAVFERVVAGLQTVNEHRIQTKDGRTLLVEWHGTPVLDENGNFDFVFGFGIDIGDRKQAEQEIEQAKEAAEAANVEACFPVNYQLPTVNCQLPTANCQLTTDCFCAFFAEKKLDNY
jgi:PAS domain S-box-containing protein